MARSPEVEFDILKAVQARGACMMDDLIGRLPQYSWGQVIAAVDRLSRTGAVSLRHERPCEYVLVAARGAGQPSPAPHGRNGGAA